MGEETDDIIDKLFEYLLQRYQKAKEESRKRGSEFIHENVDLLHYILHKTSLKRGKSYIKSPEWLENKRATINPKNKKDNKSFWYALTVALNHQNKTIAFNILFVPYNTKEIRIAYKSKYNHNRDNQVILLMITDGRRSDVVEKCHYLVVKSSSALLRGVTSNHDGDFYCLNCFHLYDTKNRL